MLRDNKLPTLDQIHALIAVVKKYPVTAGELVGMAEAVGADPRVVDFYRSFDPAVVFYNLDDLATNSEAIEMMHETKQPAEILRSPQS